MRTSLPFAVLVAAFLVPDVSSATRCLLPVAERDVLSLTVDSVTLDGAPVTDLEPWRQRARRIEGSDQGRVLLQGDNGGEEFNRVP